MVLRFPSESLCDCYRMATQCLGTTKAGRRCEKREKKAYCSQHAYQVGNGRMVELNQCVGLLDDGERCPRKLMGWRFAGSICLSRGGLLSLVRERVRSRHL